MSTLGFHFDSMHSREKQLNREMGQGTTFGHSVSYEICGGIMLLDPPEANAFCQRYIEKLLGPSTSINFIELKTQLKSQCSLSTLQELYLLLKDVLLPIHTNSQRLQMISSLLEVQQCDRRKLMNLVTHILPSGASGHDIVWTIDILRKEGSLENAIHTAQIAYRLFDFETPLAGRVLILEAISKMNNSEKKEIDLAEVFKRQEFINTVLSPKFIADHKKTYVYDDVLERGWNL